jgi:hypothetical protein
MVTKRILNITKTRHLYEAKKQESSNTATSNKICSYNCRADSSAWKHYLSTEYSVVTILMKLHNGYPSISTAFLLLFQSFMQSRAGAYCRQSAGTVTPGIGPRWDPWPYIYYLYDNYVFSFSLTRGRVWLLYMLLALASAIFLWSEPLGSSDHILLSHIWDFPFCRLLRLARWRYSIPPPHGGHLCMCVQSVYIRM